MTAAITPAVRAAFAPTGTLRAAINLGNPILAHRGDGATPAGVSVDLAHELAALLALPLALQVFDTAAESVAALDSGQADVGFFAIDPVRGAHIAFTAPYVLIEGCYLVRHDAPITSNDQVDDGGNPPLRVVVGQGSAYDLYLTRTLKHATIVRAPSSPAVVDVFLAQGADVAAGVRQQLQHDAARLGGLRLLDERFMVIEQAMGLPKARGDDAAQVLRTFVETMKARGMVDAALARHGVQGASVAPLA
ncbi:ABC transporter substrate-binding protein [Duganella sp. Leaf126]|uniref:transporter substrate-binding domain-containing protein n=1 Tax=Duganella sp. Leaf126 TaxID=1736266 RepID=UPI000700C953|nr:transporter substrate-binding domain-containing protein [Duganella sp. Leaf126]KQQ40094.1 ABC transporter substrate-binding protein [Duganella sp. Leaf126]